MSGIAGVLRIDGAPVEPALIRRLVESLTFRGPDAQTMVHDGPVALGHTLFRTTHESEHERQPYSVDGTVWIVADARIDARKDLLAKLSGTAEGLSHLAPDVELILHAYLKWGEGCVEHLLGDFAFVIWNARTRRLFCARDHMGIKPFYYADLGRWLVISNTLDCIRQHPAVSDRLNDLAIADFLLFGSNQDAGSTTYNDIRRLRPAHTLTWSENGLELHRYWSLPIEEPVYRRSDGEYLDHFNELLQNAVSDRLRGDRVGVFMSGGLDSPLLARTALEVLGTRGAPIKDSVQAFTFVYHSLISDLERSYADAAARHLEIPIHYYVQDEAAGWTGPGAFTTPEPTSHVTDRAAETRCYSEMAAHSRVAFYGEGPDNALLYEWRPHLNYLIGRRSWGRLAVDLAKHLRSHKRIPLIPTIPRMIRDRRVRKQYDAVFPPWIAPDLVARLQLEDRWRRINSRAASPHPVRPRAYASFSSPLWQSLFESLDTPCTGAPLEVRHPYVDIRLLGFMLRLPALPWCRIKYLLRRAAHGRLPQVLLTRPKTPLSGHPHCESVRRYGMPPLLPSPMLSTFGDIRALSESRADTVESICTNLRFIALSYWLRDRASFTSVHQEDKQHEPTTTAAVGLRG
jgi:asparagine synthase (glutamine-hydrolysing)